MSVVLTTESQRQHALRELFQAIKDNTTPPRGLTQDETGVIAAIGPAPMTKRAWFLERHPPLATNEEVTGEQPYRAYCFDPTHAQKPTTNPHDHLRGNLMREQLVTCQAFVLDFPVEAFEDRTSLAGVLRTASEQFTPTIHDYRRVIEKTTVGSVRDVLGLYQRTRNQPARN